MTDKFEVGEVAILVSDWPEYDGIEVVVIAPWDMYLCKARDGHVGHGAGYLTRHPDGSTHVAPRLRKLPPRQDVGSLTELERICGYRPPERVSC